ncbi:hypothetical protein [Janibacter melonis]|uniref:hypothetical protein n=1 Tax=Janibacter melonis TaxID=262209 RepID=UPI001E573F6A|nr:hypothetical protein [Janibacter melonis]MCB5993215.1 hypothetical protein [Janibacter melonis]
MTPDFYLVYLANEANLRRERVGSKEGRGVTLFCQGTVITGHVIPAWQFAEDAWREGDRADFAPYAEDLRAQRDAALEDEESLGEDDLPKFLHLDSCQIFLGSMPAPSTPGGMIRVRLEDVGGFAQGVLEPSTN